jgi:hypothetical protein
MSEIKKYTTALGETISQLDERVNVLIQRGWQPFGSIYHTKLHICQPMVSSSTEAKPYDYENEK